MKPSADFKFTVGLDIGSSHTTMVVGQLSSAEEPVTLFPPSNEEGGRTQILGAARVLNSGMKRGTMINLDAVTHSVQEALDEVERQTGLNIEGVRVSVASPLSMSDNFTDEIPVKSNEVKASDIEKLASHSRSMKPQQGFDYIHYIHTHYALDGKTGIQNPLGMWGAQLSAVYHRVLFPQAELHNVIKACNLSGLRVHAIVHEALAAAESTLSPDEKELGSISINIGSTLTHVAIYVAGSPVFCRDYPIGAHHITKDLSVGLRTTQSEAERIKRDYGQAYYDPLLSSDVLEIQTIDAKSKRTVTRGEIFNIIEPRVKEIFATIHADLRKQKLAGQLLKSVVLSGGGAAMNGICIIAEDYFGIHTRIGYPLALAGLTEGLTNTQAACGVGLLSSLFEHPDTSRILSRHHKPKEPISAIAKSLWEKIRDPFT